MAMVYYNNGGTPSQVFGYDDSDANQAPLITAAKAANWSDVTASWPPPVTATRAVQAASLLASKIAAGIAITSNGTPALNATYALDALTLSQIQSVAQDAASGLGLPGGASTFTYPDITGQPHSFTAAQLIAVYRAMRDLLLILNTQSAILANGGPANWPATQAATIA